jgi:hypothetical protein
VRKLNHECTRIDTKKINPFSRGAAERNPPQLPLVARKKSFRVGAAGWTGKKESSSGVGEGQKQ